MRFSLLTLIAALIATGPAAGQELSDTRVQYPAWLADSFVSLTIGGVGYQFSGEQLPSGVQAVAVDAPPLTVRVALFGHEFNRYFAVQGSYMRPLQFVSYLQVNGAPPGDHHHVRVDVGSVSATGRLPLAARIDAYGEGGLAFTSRSGFLVADKPAVTDAHFTSPLIGGGIDVRLNPNWTVTTGLTYIPGRSSVLEHRTLLTSGGIRYTMRRLDAAQLADATDARFVFPRQVLHLEYSSGVGYSINDFVATKVPIFWSGNAKVDIGVAPHYERNVFHTRRTFAFDVGTSAGVYVTRARDDHFYTVSAYPLFRFVFARTRPLDAYFAYSVAGPTFISKVVLDALDTGRHFTFQDFMGVGLFAGTSRQWSVGVKINHFSNGNIFTHNAAVSIPLTFWVGHAF